MRIAQVAPLYESVPPKMYGGTERVVSYLTEELVRQGHDVTLFASADSVTLAELTPICARSLRLDRGCVDQLAHHILMLEQVFKRAEAGAFDVIHFHVDYLHFPMSRRCGVPHVTTLHGRLDLPDLPPIYREFPDMPVVSISNSQREPLPDAHWQGTVYHGLPLDLYTPAITPGDYLVFVGRISPEKRIDYAIEIAGRVGMKLVIAAKVDPADQRYFNERIKPLLANPWVEFIGEVAEPEKQDLLANALAFVFPIDWPEPFGLAMIESMACGTPVVAFRRGSVPEVVDEGLTGFVVDDVAGAVSAVERAAALDRKACRRVFEERFRAARMATDYLAIYERLAVARPTAPSIEKGEHNWAD